MIAVSCWSRDERIEKLRDVLKRMERALGEENVVILDTLGDLGGQLQEKGECEEAIKVLREVIGGEDEGLRGTA